MPISGSEWGAAGSVFWRHRWLEGRAPCREGLGLNSGADELTRPIGSVNDERLRSHERPVGHEPYSEVPQLTRSGRRRIFLHSGQKIEHRNSGDQANTGAEILGIWTSSKVFS